MVITSFTSDFCIFLSIEFSLWRFLLTFLAQHAHPKTDESKRNKNFLKLTSTPLLESILSSPNESESKKEEQAGNVMSFLGGKQTEKKGSYRSNYYKELFNDPLDQSPTTSKLVKTDKVIVFGSSKRNYNQDELQTIREDAKIQHGYTSTSRSKLY